MVESREHTPGARAGTDETAARPKRLWHLLLVALAVTALTTTVGWAMAPAEERPPPRVVEPPLPAVPLPTLAGAAPSGSARPVQPVRASPSGTTSPSRSAPPEPTRTTSPTPGPASPTPSRSPEVPELTPLPASSERELRAEDGGPETTVEFVNRRDDQVTLYRLNEWGYRVRVTRLAAGESHPQATQVGHPWVVTNRYGSTLAVFQPVAEPARAIIQ
ncbi:hypothetical protein [Micromonospora cathayae]|uniref:von Hippel-Lindau disease tumour suppressor protein n=1 Tax=Micromonospora cathayae TaxID=3028804 RepID=A0ABY7ZTP4_9ACTN|nr:hypothetical protein [Micromonospora sp. HUAS 3]WDZ86387.1 hypothetical protein PVK37_08285 [Micromonospora sp. HUAS 3]